MPTNRAPAIHGLIFHQKMSFCPQEAENPLLRALAVWQTAWDSSLLASPTVASSEEGYWKRDGFMQHGDEFAALARVHLKLSHLLPEKGSELFGRPSDRGDRIATFNQAGMGQIGRLIAAVENFHLNT